MMSLKRNRLIRWWPLLLLIPLIGYWFLPLSGKVMVTQGAAAEERLPSIQLDPVRPAPGEITTIRVRDNVPWAHVRLTVDGELAEWRGAEELPDGTIRWQWRISYPEAPSASVLFYRDCDTGCIEQARLKLAGRGTGSKGSPALPTKLGLVFPDFERNWHGRSGWAIELTYSRVDDTDDWGIDSLAARVQQAKEKGLRVLVRVDYDRGQSVPPTGDEKALQSYLRYLKRLGQDERLQDVYGYIIGSGYNALDANSHSRDRPVTPAWYARLFNGYSRAPGRSDNIVQTLHGANPRIRILVGPVRPWTFDQDGDKRHRIDVPWLNYMNTLVAALEAGAIAKARAGIATVAPDGFALQVPGRPEAQELEGRDPAKEPRLSLPREEWNGAQAGFRLYEDWLEIINTYPSTRGLPVYISSTNTYTPDTGTPPARNYPRGWLTNALQVINSEPQVRALCWFLDIDHSGDTQWEQFALSHGAGRLEAVAEEFDRLLKVDREMPGKKADSEG